MSFRAEGQPVVPTSLFASTVHGPPGRLKNQRRLPGTHLESVPELPQGQTFGMLLSQALKQVALRLSGRPYSRREDGSPYLSTIIVRVWTKVPALNL